MLTVSKDLNGVGILWTSIDDFWIDWKDSLFGGSTIWNWEPTINTLTGWTDPDTGITYIEPRIWSGITDTAFYWDIYSAWVWWITFDVMTVDRVKVNLGMPNPYINTWTVTWYAWWENVGWILFWDAICGSSCKVDYIPETQMLSWYAWSPAAWYLSLSWIHASVTPPPWGLCNYAMSGTTDDAKIVNMPQFYGSWYGAGDWNVKIETWTGWSLYTYIVPVSSWNPPTINHDFRRAGDYYYEIKTPDGWIMTGTTRIYAWEPTSTPFLSWACQLSIYTGGCETTGDTSYLTTYPFQDPLDPFNNILTTTSTAADGTSEFLAVLRLRDKYGNPVIPIDGIKWIRLSVGIENDVKLNQLESGPMYDLVWAAWSNSWSAIRFWYNDFWLGIFWDSILTWGIWQNEWANFLTWGFFVSGDYVIPMSSYAPTSVAYPWAWSGWNNIRLVSMKYEIVSLVSGTWMGETSIIDISSLINTGALRFDPLFQVARVNNFTGGYMYAGAPIYLEWELIHTWTADINQVYISNIIWASNEYTDSGITFVEMSGWTMDTYTECSGYLDGSGTYQYGWNPYCDRSLKGASNIVFSLTNILFTGSFYPFQARPALSTSILSGTYIPLQFSSEIYYEFSGWIRIAYPSFQATANAILQAWLSFSGVHIIGRTNHNNIFVTTDQSLVEPVWTITKQDVRLLVQKNVALLTRWTDISNINLADGSYWYHEPASFFQIGWPWTWTQAGKTKETLIIYGQDVYINWDIPIDLSRSTPKWLIALKDENWNGGNIYIGSWVTDIALVMYADKTLFSGDCGETFWPGCWSYTLPQQKENQLHFVGTLIANNTIGWSPQYIAKCPYDAPWCNSSTAYQYDFNHFRYYNGVTWLPSLTVPSWSEYNSFVLEYDSRVIPNPPTGFKDISW